MNIHYQINRPNYDNGDGSNMVWALGKCYMYNKYYPSNILLCLLFLWFYCHKYIFESFWWSWLGVIMYQNNLFLRKPLQWYPQQLLVLSNWLNWRTDVSMHWHHSRVHMLCSSNIIINYTKLPTWDSIVVFPRCICQCHVSA